MTGDTTFFHEEAGRNKTSKEILHTWCKRKASASMNLSWLIALRCGPRKRLKREEEKLDGKNSCLCSAPVVRYSQLRVTQDECFNLTRWKGFRESESWQMISKPKQLELSFSSVAGYQLPACRHCGHDGSFHQVGEKLLCHRAQWKKHDKPQFGLAIFSPTLYGLT